MALAATVTDQLPAEVVQVEVRRIYLPLVVRSGP
jgi:hypothetical protein